MRPEIEKLIDDVEKEKISIEDAIRVTYGLYRKYGYEFWQDPRWPNIFEKLILHPRLGEIIKKLRDEQRQK